jgi:hypothetical protein
MTVKENRMTTTTEKKSMLIKTINLPYSKYYSIVKNISTKELFSIKSKKDYLTITLRC